MELIVLSCLGSVALTLIFALDDNCGSHLGQNKE
jgi:hypothetical protein